MYVGAYSYQMPVLLLYCHTHLIDVEVVAGVCFRALVDLTFLSSYQEQVVIERIKANSCPRTCLEGQGKVCVLRRGQRK